MEVIEMTDACTVVKTGLDAALSESDALSGNTREALKAAREAADGGSMDIDLDEMVAMLTNALGEEPEEIAKNALDVELLEVPKVLRANDSDSDAPQTNDNGLTPLETGGYLTREDL
jgi:hypothetical protein